MDLEKLKLSNEFNSELNSLVKILYEKNRTSQIEMIKTAVASAIRNVPLSLIEGTDDFWNYRNDILSIKNNDGTYDWSKIDSIPIPEKADQIMVNVVRDIFNNATEDERIDALNRLIRLLVIVANYRRLVKQ